MAAPRPAVAATSLTGAAGGGAPPYSTKRLAALS